MGVLSLLLSKTTWQALAIITIAVLVGTLGLYVTGLRNDLTKTHERLAEERLAREIAEANVKSLQIQHAQMVLEITALSEARSLAEAQWDQTDAAVTDIPDRNEDHVEGSLSLVDDLNRVSRDVNRMLERTSAGN